ncbi:MAG TPA: DUF480 domain-containing protein, partial [Alicycliphilus sp.]|nr:DUF480 domain-containing protein [Alicycliphilus sp.]
RWAQLLCGPVDVQALQVASAGTAAPADTALQARVEALEAEVAGLQATVRRLCAELGLDAPLSPPAQE